MWKENAEIVKWFLFFVTQWRVAAHKFGVSVLGMDYGAIVPVLRDAMGRKRRKAALEGLRVMELAALPLLNKRRGG